MNKPIFKDEESAAKITLAAGFIVLILLSLF